MTRMRPLRGMTLVELTVALGIISILVLASAAFVGTNTQISVLNQDRALAVQKATQMVQELRGVAENPSVIDASVLDSYDDGNTTNNVLTTDNTVTNPAHEASGNVAAAWGWRYSRRISVRKFPSLNTRDIRIVEARVFLQKPGDTDAIELADVTSVINTVAQAYPPSQVYDVYLLAMENVPGWWVYMANIKPFIENTLDDMEARQPGLVFRRHWITKLGYGRDSLYRPYVNNTADSTAAIPWVYFYPGTMPAGSSVSQYYVPGLMNARINVDGTTTNDYNALTNPYPYAFADQYNHCMRQPTELALWSQRVASGQETSDVKTWHLLLDDMVANPNNYLNAIFINLHGELVPFPPTRNYSDPAKEPTGFANVRVVTHPQKICFLQTDNLVLRVYAYYEDAGALGQDTLDTGPSNAPISVFIPGANFTTPGDVTMTAIRGGTDRDPADGTPDPYAAVTPAPTTPGVGTCTQRMYATTSYVGGATPGTLFLLYKTPLRCPYIAAPTTGLNAGWRLYGDEYIPCCCEATNDFTTNLVSAGNKPKNTARWIITVAKASLDRELGVGANRLIAIQTRLGSNLHSGTVWPVANQPGNVSTTYAWRNTYAVYDANQVTVPFSERFQFQGDPRHCPYQDVKAGNGYNWYFDNMRDATTNTRSPTDYWPGFDTARIRNTLGNDYDGWHGSGANGLGADSTEVDVPRYFEMLRTALCTSNSIYTTLTGFSYYYMGNGNEIGYDSANGFPNSIPTNPLPFTGVNGAARQEMSITTGSGTAVNGGVKLVRENVNGYWWSKTWLGELYPDSQWATWSASGNLNTGVGGGFFVRIRRQDIAVSGPAPLAKAGSLPSGTTFNDHTTLRRLNALGCTSFFNIGTTTSTFRHNYRDGTSGSLSTGGNQLATTYNFPLPTSALISRPAELTYNTTTNEFSQPDYVALRASATNNLTYYSHQDGTPPWNGSALIREQLLASSGASPSCFITVSGIDRTVESGSAFIATYSCLTLIHTFLESGLPGTPSRVTQLPQIVILNPNDSTDLENPATIAIQWAKNWTRWDGLKYTPDYAAGFAESDALLKYQLLYSTDNGKTWLNMVNDSAATPGTPNTSLWLSTMNPGGNETYMWDVSGRINLPEASYLIRVEAYRSTIPTHYAFHQQKIYIHRQ